MNHIGYKRVFYVCLLCIYSLLIAMSVYIKYQENSELLDSLNHVFFFLFNLFLLLESKLFSFFASPRLNATCFLSLYTLSCRSTCRDQGSARQLYEAKIPQAIQASHSTEHDPVCVSNPNPLQIQRKPARFNHFPVLFCPYLWSAGPLER